MAPEKAAIEGDVTADVMIVVALLVLVAADLVDETVAEMVVVAEEMTDLETGAEEIQEAVMIAQLLQGRAPKAEVKDLLVVSLNLNLDQALMDQEKFGHQGLKNNRL